MTSLTLHLPGHTGTPPWPPESWPAARRSNPVARSGWPASRPRAPRTHRSDNRSSAPKERAGRGTGWARDLRVGSQAGGGRLAERPIRTQYRRRSDPPAASGSPHGDPHVQEIAHRVHRHLLPGVDHRADGRGRHRRSPRWRSVLADGHGVHGGPRLRRALQPRRVAGAACAASWTRQEPLALLGGAGGRRGGRAGGSP